MKWDDCEFGAPTIDCKRPYGNSDVIGDIVEILEIIKTVSIQFENINYFTIDEESDVELPMKLYIKLEEIHKETQIALQIFLQTGAMRPGIYEREKYGFKWTLILSPGMPDTTTDGTRAQNLEIIKIGYTPNIADNPSFSNIIDIVDETFDAGAEAIQEKPIGMPDITGKIADRNSPMTFEEEYERDKKNRRYKPTGWDMNSEYEPRGHDCNY